MSTKTNKCPSMRKLGVDVPQDEHNYIQIHVVTAAFPSVAGESGKVKVEIGLRW